MKPRERHEETMRVIEFVNVAPTEQRDILLEKLGETDSEVRVKV